MWILLAVASLLMATAQLLPAQFPSDVRVGSRVRVLLPDSVRQVWGPRVQSVHGEVAGVATDTLYLRVHATPSLLAVPRHSIKRLERSLGVPGRSESAVRGAVAGAFWLGLVALAADRTGRGWDDDVGTTAAIGAGIGFVFGAIFPTERWRRIRLR
jgi:hypothetical protein